ncbi:phage holin family protein [Falsirhodobacter halotolerans]|uniref:phage holin family protein n=1 Tax=Falsirhodobacter halotolerans TaxID=1146892 RepID=UPI001FD32692|nr:phage holin family protein [Falsirhodobacter halotolerans]MCJ8139185.1 phage holin family protein [Falsirhodobacter halotolerans]
MDDPNRKSTTGLMGDLVGNVNELFRKEIQLLRAETSEKISQAFTAVGKIAAGLVIVLVALNVLAFALVAGLAELGLGAGWAAVLVGVIFSVIALILVKNGINDLKAGHLAPARTANSLSKDANAIKDTVS